LTCSVERVSFALMDDGLREILASQATINRANGSTMRLLDRRLRRVERLATPTVELAPVHVDESAWPIALVWFLAGVMVALLGKLILG